MKARSIAICTIGILALMSSTVSAWAVGRHTPMMFVPEDHTLVLVALGGTGMAILPVTRPQIVTASLRCCLTLRMLRG